MISTPRVRYYKTLKLAIPSRPNSRRPPSVRRNSVLYPRRAFKTLDGEWISLKQELEEKEGIDYGSKPERQFTRQSNPLWRTAGAGGRRCRALKKRSVSRRRGCSN